MNASYKTDISELISSKAAWMRELRAYITPFILLIIFISKYLLAFPIPVFPIIILFIFVLLYNSFFIYIESKYKEVSLTYGTIFATIRVALDFLGMAFLIHLSGGISSPFVYLYLFSISGYAIATGSSLASALLCIWATITYSTVLLLEKFKIISHYSLMPNDISYLNLRMIIINIIVFLFVMITLAFMVVRLIRLLEKKEVEILLKTEEIKKTRDFLDATFNAADDLIFVIDTEGRLLDINNRALSIFGLTHDEVIGQHISKVFLNKEIVEKILKGGKGEISSPYEIVLVSRNGVELSFEIRVSIIPNVGQVLIARDISKRKKYEEEIREANRRLERELNEIKRLNKLIVSREEELARLKQDLRKFKD